MSGISWGSRWPFAPRCLDSQSFSPCRRIDIPVRRVAASCLQRHAQHPPPQCTIVAAAGVALMRFNDGGVPLCFFRSLLLAVLICRLPTYSQPELIRSQILFLSQLAVHVPGTFVRQPEETLSILCFCYQYRHIQRCTRLAGDVVGGSQSIHHNLISLGGLSSLSSFGHHHGDDPHRTRRFAEHNHHPT